MLQNRYAANSCRFPLVLGLDHPPISLVLCITSRLSDYFVPLLLHAHLVAPEVRDQRIAIEHAALRFRLVPSRSSLLGAGKGC